MCKVSEARMLTFHETRCGRDSINIPKMDLFLIFTFYIISQVSILNFHLTWLVFRISGIKAGITEVSEQSKRQISALNVIAIRDQRHANVSKQTTVWDGVDVGPLQLHPKSKSSFKDSQWKCKYNLN